jgi:nicotinamidase-related amidase
MSGAPALILIDLQKAIDDPSWGSRNNPSAEERARAVLELWRQRGWPLFHVRHDSREPESKYRPGQPLHAWKPEAAPLAGEPVLGKTTCNAFASTDLAARLRAAGASRVFVCGVITNNSVESTVRAGGDLGFSMYLVEDACFTFGKGRWTAQDVHEMSLMNLEGEYAKITTSTRVVAEFLDNRYEGPDAPLPVNQ